MIQEEDVKAVALQLNLSITDNDIQFVLENFDAQADSDPTGYWKIWIEDLLYQRM